jgi:hypothetical protein
MSSNKPTLELIVHCWAGQLRQYADFLRYQLSSLLLHPPENCRVQHTLCCSHDDAPTVSAWFNADSHPVPPNVAFRIHPMTQPHLWRRAIGRHECARASNADVVWFGGVDYTFGRGCLDEVVACATHSPRRLCYPRIIRIHKTHEMGDTAACRASRAPPGSLMAIDPSEFRSHRIRRPIGCLQIVPGDAARKYGYVPGMARFHKPAGRWRRTHEDKYYRKVMAKAGYQQLAIKPPNLFRLRHSRQGRFVNLLGKPL